MRDMHSLVGTNEPIRDVASAEAALKLHFDHKAEIEARSSKVTAVANFGKLLIERGHPANSQISEKLILLETEKVDLMKFWENRKVRRQTIIIRPLIIKSALLFRPGRSPMDIGLAAIR